MRKLFVYLMMAAGLALPAGAAKKSLHLSFIDTEGGQATLLVTPSGESLLVDAGFPGNNGRDSDRIVAAAKKAGLQRIDYLLVTHYHLDHVGGVPEFAAKFPVGTVIDHGANTETGGSARKIEAGYLELVAKGVKRLTVKPGDVLPLKEIRVEVVTARGERMAKAVKGGGKYNPLCAQATRRADDATENARSIGVVVTFGKFRFVDLGDLTWNKELDIACPEHMIGPVDLYLTTHHGTDSSGPAAIVHGLQPRVAIMNNGAKKGGSAAAWKVVSASPGLEDMWQVHYALAGGKEANVQEERIANVEEKCQGFGIEVEAEKDRKFTVTNLRSGQKKSYKP
ncbi:MAG: MBL fold metallo-hydrolase [Candidatus Solibacter usitatus]|nr:MBL fold metallo-hydrolase [Candidatus Solibacter usitatus]